MILGKRKRDEDDDDDEYTSVSKRMKNFHDADRYITPYDLIPIRYDGCLQTPFDAHSIIDRFEKNPEMIEVLLNDTRYEGQFKKTKFPETFISLSLSTRNEIMFDYILSNSNRFAFKGAIDQDPFGIYFLCRSICYCVIGYDFQRKEDMLKKLLDKKKVDPYYCRTEILKSSSIIGVFMECSESKILEKLLYTYPPTKPTEVEMIRILFKKSFTSCTMRPNATNALFKILGQPLNGKLDCFSASQAKLNIYSAVEGYYWKNELSNLKVALKYYAVIDKKFFGDKFLILNSVHARRTGFIGSLMEIQKSKYYQNEREKYIDLLVDHMQHDRDIWSISRHCYFPLEIRSQVFFLCTLFRFAPSLYMFPPEIVMIIIEIYTSMIIIKNRPTFTCHKIDWAKDFSRF